MSFRQFGGLQYAAKNNYVSNNYLSSTDLQIRGNLGQPNSAISVLSDLSGNQLFTGDLTVEGNVFATGFITLSDYRMKENVKALDDKYVVDGLKPVTYTLKTDNTETIGLIAHEVQEHFPSLVYGEKDGQELQSIHYVGLIPILIKEIQDLKREIAALKARTK